MQVENLFVHVFSDEMKVFTPKKVPFGAVRGKWVVGRWTLLCFLCGFVFGFVLQYDFFATSESVSYREKDVNLGGVSGNLHEIPLPPDGPKDPAKVNLTVGPEKLEEDVRVLCWIMTQPKSHKKKARHVKATWGTRCNYLLFMSSGEDKDLPSVKLNVSEGRNALWSKTKEAFKHVYQHYLTKVDWVLKADDDTYVVVENLRYVLSQQNSSERLYLGCHFKPFVKQGYMSGGAGYVLSKEAVRAFVEEALPKKSCRQDAGGAEDLEMGKCLEQVGVRIVDSRDHLGRHRFLPLAPRFHLIPGAIPKKDWFWKYIYHPVKSGFECCSSTMVSFHYVSPNLMYVLEFLIYHVQVYGSDDSVEKPTPTLPARN